MSEIPKFPNFTPIGLLHRAHVMGLTDRFLSYSDYNFVSMFSWDTEGVGSFSMLNGNLVLRFNDYIDGSVFLSFLGKREITDTVEKLFEYCRNNNIDPGLRLIGQEIIEYLPESLQERIKIEEDRDGYDYILSIADLSELRTSQYGTKKRMHNRFVRNYAGRVRCQPLDLGDEDVIQQIQKTVDAWQRAVQRSDETVRNELVALERCLKYAAELTVEAYGTYVDSKLVAFTLYEVLPGNIVMGHFLKADSKIDGVFIHLLHNFAKYLQSRGVKYINIEQDIGIEGLRKSKEGLKPVDFLKKYTISPRS